MRAWLLAAIAAVQAGGADAAAASGRNWRIDIDRLTCEASLLTIGMRVRYFGPRGPVEAPVSRVIDAGGMRYLPRSLVWSRGSKAHAEWLSRGGLSNVQSEQIGEFQLKFELGAASGDVKLEFGDVDAIVLTRAGKGGCAGLLSPGDLKAPSVSRARSAKGPFRVFRRAYPCISSSKAVQTIAAEHPPYLPRQLLVFGRGYLPSAREIELPMGRAPAQSYAYFGPDDMKGLEDAARRSVLADFPVLAKSRHFAFDWGVQRGASGNDVWSIGLYELRPCRT